MRNQPPMSNTGALIANVSLRSFGRLCRLSVVRSSTYTRRSGQHQSTRFGAAIDTETRVLAEEQDERAKQPL